MTKPCGAPAGKAAPGDRRPRQRCRHPAAGGGPQHRGRRLHRDLKGDLTAGKAAEPTVSVTKNGKPVTGLQSYLDTYAHLTAFHEGDQAFAHLHPGTNVNGDRGGPDLSFHAELPDPGNTARP
ncbi:hypothetical protein [Streptomyces glaucus]|uniref:CHRD domain-containing protein n=1 Tax=Streptomyces glaucus TaxID=284029 RepID=A0ABP5XAG8_9ACTN